MDLPFSEDDQADAFFEELLGAVDQQLESADTPYVKLTLERLVKEGANGTEAKEAIARCLAEETDRVLRSGRPFDAKRYQEALAAITVEEEE